MENYTLQHHGIRGMKWGIRRYQNKDGSLTKAGQKRYDKELEKVKSEQKRIKTAEKTKAKLDKLKAMQDDVAARKKALLGEDETVSKSKTSDINPKKKSVHDMSDDELRTIVNRLSLEQQYKALNPKHESVGKKFFDKAVNSAVDGGATVVKDWTVKKLKDHLGLNAKDLDPLKELEREFKTLSYKEGIRKMKANQETK